MAALHHLIRRRFTGGASGALPSLRAWGAADQVGLPPCAEGCTVPSKGTTCTKSVPSTVETPLSCPAQPTAWRLLPAAQGALGVEEGLQDVFEPEAVLGIEGAVRRVGAGHYTSCAVTDGGELWSWGRAKELQLGRPPSEPGRPLCPRPGRVEGLPGQAVSATGSGVVSFAVTADGGLWAWGSSRRGQLGLGRDVLETGRPRRVALPAPVLEVAAGWGHAAAWTDDGRVFTWGWPAHGRLGHSFASSAEEDGDEGRLAARCVWEPREVELLRGVKVGQVACGFDHSLILASDGTLLSFGDNSLHQLGRPEGGAAWAAPCEGAAVWLVHAQNESGKPKKFRRVRRGLGGLRVCSDACVGASWSGIGGRAEEWAWRVDALWDPASTRCSSRCRLPLCSAGGGGAGALAGGAAGRLRHRVGLERRG